MVSRAAKLVGFLGGAMGPVWHSWSQPDEPETAESTDMISCQETRPDTASESPEGLRAYNIGLPELQKYNVMKCAAV